MGLRLLRLKRARPAVRLGHGVPGPERGRGARHQRRCGLRREALTLARSSLFGVPPCAPGPPGRGRDRVVMEASPRPGRQGTSHSRDARGLGSAPGDRPHVVAYRTSRADATPERWLLLLRARAIARDAAAEFRQRRPWRGRWARQDGGRTTVPVVSSWSAPTSIAGSKRGWWQQTHRCVRPRLYALADPRDPARPAGVGPTARTPTR